MKKLFKLFSFSSGITSHVAPELSDYIPEGGELGTALSSAYSAACDDPDRIIACVVSHGKKCEHYWRSHQVPMGDMDKPEHIRILEQWMKSYRPDELFDTHGRLKAELEELAPKGHHRMSDNPHANGGLLMRDLKMPD